MPIDDQPESALRRACRIVGGQSAFGRLVGKAQSTVNERLKKGLPIWAESVLLVEQATGISRHELRPDLYPPETPGAAGNSLSVGGTTLLEGVTR